MARLQDFPSVTPTSSDNLLIVQSQGQGLANFGTVMGTKMDKANPTGTGKLSINRRSGSSEGEQSIAVGSLVTASGNYSHAEGRETTASGNNGSHAEGYQSTASGDRSHAEGSATTASGNSAHAEGVGCTASGGRSHAEGNATIANHYAQHVFGSCNVADTSTAAATSRGNYVEIVGNGADDANRSNARTLDWSGNEVLAGGLKINGNQEVPSARSYDLTSTSTEITLTKMSGYFMFKTPTGSDTCAMAMAYYLIQNTSVNIAFLTQKPQYITVTGSTGKKVNMSSSATYGTQVTVVEIL